MGARSSSLGCSNSAASRDGSSHQEPREREVKDGKSSLSVECTHPPSPGLATDEDKALHSVTTLYLCPHVVAFGGASKKVTVWNWDKSQTLASLIGPEKAITQVSGVHGPSCIYASSRDSNVYGWSVNVDRPQSAGAGPDCVFRGHSLSVTSLTGSPDHSEYLCTGARDTTVKLWDTSTQTCVREKSISRNIVTQIQWLGSEMGAVQCSEDRSVKIWDMRTMEVVQVFSTNSILTCCDVSSDLNYLSTGERGSGAKIRIWDRRSGKALSDFKGHLSTVTCTKFLQTSTGCVASCSEDGFVRLWDMSVTAGDSRGATVISKSVPASGGLTCIELLPDNLVACTSLDAGLSIWRLDRSSKSMSLKLQY